MVEGGKDEVRDYLGRVPPRWPPLEMASKWELLTLLFRVMVGVYLLSAIPEMRFLPGVSVGIAMIGYGLAGAVILFERKWLERARRPVGWGTRLLDVATASYVAFRGEGEALIVFLLPIGTSGTTLGPMATLLFCILSLLGHVAAWAGGVSPSTVVGSLLLFIASSLAFFLLSKGFEMEWKRGVEIESRRGVLDLEQAIRATRDMERLFNLILSAAMVRAGGERAAIFLLDEDKRNLFLREAIGFEHLEEGQRLSLSEGVMKRALHTKTPQVVKDFEHESPREWEILRCRSGLLVPLGASRGVAGVIGVFSDKVGVFGELQEKAMTRLAEEASATLENAQLLARLREESRTDPLTKLYNRRYFTRRLREEIRRAERHQYILSLVIFDIDNFKRVNDEFGHLAGDRILRMVGRLLKQGSRESDIPAKFGGEEFSVILPYTPKEGGLKYAERIRRSIEGMSVKVDEESVKVTVSGGVATFPEDASTPEELMAAADSALYQAKMAGRNCVRAAPPMEG